MTVVGISSSPRRLAGFDRMDIATNWSKRCANCDYFLLLTPLFAETHDIVGTEVFAAMKPQSFLDQSRPRRGGGRGGVARGAREGRIAGAALDVFATEPLPQEHPFWAMENVLITSPPVGDARRVGGDQPADDHGEHPQVHRRRHRRHEERRASGEDVKFSVASAVGTFSAISIRARVITHFHAIASTPRGGGGTNAAPYFGSM